MSSHPKTYCHVGTHRNDKSQTNFPALPSSIVAVVFVAASSALEVIPYTLAENAGMNPISIVTELRSEHAKGKVGAGESMGALSSLVVEARLSS